MHNVPHRRPPHPHPPPSLLLPISLSLSFHPMSFVWRDGGEPVMEGNGKTQGRGKKERGDEPLSSLHLLSFFFFKGKKKNKGRTCNSVLSIVLTRPAEC